MCQFMDVMCGLCGKKTYVLYQMRFWSRRFVSTIMTLFLPLHSPSPSPRTPPFLALSSNPPAQLQKLIQTILKARRIVVVCGLHPVFSASILTLILLPGAGISVQAGIPDFRSPRGLFRTLKRDNLASGKDLFDASVFNV